MLRRLWWRLTWFWHMGHGENCADCGEYRTYFDEHVDYPDLCVWCGVFRKAAGKKLRSGK